MAQSVKRLTSDQLMISLSVSLTPISGSVLTAQSLEPASDSTSPSLSAPSLTCALSLSDSQKWIIVKKLKKKKNQPVLSSLSFKSEPILLSSPPLVSGIFSYILHLFIL